MSIWCATVKLTGIPVSRTRLFLTRAGARPSRSLLISGCARLHGFIPALCVGRKKLLHLLPQRWVSR